MINIRRAALIATSGFAGGVIGSSLFNLTSASSPPSQNEKPASLYIGSHVNLPHEVPPTPGSPTRLKNQLLETGAALIQQHPHFHEHLCGIHFVNGEGHRQVEAHHYCHHINDDFRQCVIYDSPSKHAKLIGVEYVISKNLFEKLPDEEKKLWHSHNYEVLSGMLIAPRLPAAAEHAAMNELVDTYGKTWHTWQVDRGDSLPLGIPTLMMGFTSDDQIYPEILSKAHGQYNVDVMQKRKERADIPEPKVHPLANSWEKGEVYQVVLHKQK